MDNKEVFFLIWLCSVPYAYMHLRFDVCIKTCISKWMKSTKIVEFLCFSILLTRHILVSKTDICIEISYLENERVNTVCW